MQGATAFHEQDGDLSAFIEACTVGARFKRHGLRSCELDVQTLGNYTITFFLSKVLSIPSNAVSRTIVVVPDCPADEALCRDLSSCSSSGFCLDGSRRGAVIQNTPPTLSLRSNEPSIVHIPRGSSYDVCENSGHSITWLNSSAVLDHLCEAGPVAYDETDGFITERVLACPPVSCIPFGCSGHELHVKGLAGCGVDTENAPVGTAFNITFTVFDSHRPAASASLVRSYVIVSPCLAAEVYCPELSDPCGTALCSVQTVTDSYSEEEPDIPPPNILVGIAHAPAGTAHFSAAAPDAAADTIGTLSVHGICGKATINVASVCGTASLWHCCRRFMQQWRRTLHSSSQATGPSSSSSGPHISTNCFLLSTRPLQCSSRLP